MQDAPPGYYSNATGTGSTLKSQLIAAMSAGHIQGRYGDFRFSAAIHDQDPNNASNIRLVYNGASVNSEWDSGATWNREHVWPQSRQPGTASSSTTGNLGDPHALRPSTPGVNSARGNAPFGFDNSEGLFGSVGEYWFPGDECKGDIARSLFYSDTRWTSQGISLTDDFPTGNQMGDLSSLTAWHYLDPPDEFERRRNHTIFSSEFNPDYFTNNRNAYIDRPEFVWSVYVDQMNDSMITIAGGNVDGAGGSRLDLEFGTVIVGANQSLQTVTLDKAGMDGTYYSVEAAGDANSVVAGQYNAFRSNGTDSQTISVRLNSDTPGIKAGQVIVDNLDVTTLGGIGRGDNDGDDVINLKLAVLDHSNASFRQFDLNVLSIDLGEFASGETIPDRDFEIHNIQSVFGGSLTSRLSLLSVTPSTETSLLVNGPLFTDLPAGEFEQFSISGIASGEGSVLIGFDLLLSDEALPGATTETITLFVAYEVTGAVLLGDVNLDGAVNLLDVTPFIEIISNGGFQIEADVNQDGSVNPLDIEPFIALLSG